MIGAEQSVTRFLHLRIVRNRGIVVPIDATRRWLLQLLIDSLNTLCLERLDHFDTYVSGRYRESGECLSLARTEEGITFQERKSIIFERSEVRELDSSLLMMETDGADGRFRDRDFVHKKQSCD